MAESITRLYDFKARVRNARNEDELDEICRLWLVRKKPVIEVREKDAAQKLLDFLRLRHEDASVGIMYDGWLLSLYPPAHRYDVGAIPEKWFGRRVIIEKIGYPEAILEE